MEGGWGSVDMIAPYQSGTNLPDVHRAKREGGRSEQDMLMGFLCRAAHFIRHPVCMLNKC